MAFAQRILNFRFQLGQGAFGASGADTVDLTGVRAIANVSKAGGNSVASADLSIFGMTIDVMNKLTVLNTLAYPEMRNNIVTVEAGDEQSGTSACFVGTIKEAWADGQGAPDVLFHVSAFSALFDRLKPIPPTSYNGSVDVATVVSGIAAQMDMGLENNGVSASIESPYLPGDLGSQLQQIARAAGIGYLIDTVDRVVAIWPQGGSRDGPNIVISKEAGLVGYPTFTEQGCRFTTIYNPSLVFGRQVDVKSEFSAASGTWTIANVNHNLDTLVPGGTWFTSVDCTLAGHSLPIISGG